MSLKENEMENGPQGMPPEERINDGTRKRKNNTGTWKRNVRKKLNNLRTEHIDSTGKAKKKKDV